MSMVIDMSIFEKLYNILKPHQRYIVDKIIKNFDKYSVFLVNAPTGSGKTLVALTIARWLYEQKQAFRFGYYVRTHNEYYPVVRDIKKFGIGLKPVPIIGKYRCCRNPLKVFYKWFIELQELCRQCSYPKDVEAPEIIDTYLETMSIDEVIKVAERFGCPYYTILNMTKYVDIVLATYPYLVGAPKTVLESYTNIHFQIIDEAHNLENIHQYMSSTLSLNTLSYLQQVGFYVLPLIQLHQSKYDEDKKIVYIDKALIKGALHEIDNKIFNICLNPFAYTSQYSQDVIRSVIELCQFIQNIQYPFFDVYLTKHGFRLLATDPYELIRNVLDRPTLLMSGSLPSEEYIKTVWGVDGLYIDIEKELGFRYGYREWFIAYDVTTKLALRKQFIDSYKQYLDKLLEKTEPIQLVVFPSYDFMNQFKAIGYKHKCIIEQEERTPIEWVIQEALNNRVKCIFAVAGGKLTEGIEITKDGRSLIKTIIMVGIPYPEPSDYLKKKEQKLSKRIKITPVTRYTYLFHEPAKILIKQAIGRGIRHEEDRNMIFLLDWRYKHFIHDLNIDDFTAIQIKKKTVSDNGINRHL